ncbi:unnamed protein product [Calypogeia fissa]
MAGAFLSAATGVWAFSLDVYMRKEKTCRADQSETLQR